MYLQNIANRIRSFVPEDRIPDKNADELFLLYAVLLRVKGTEVTESDIHDAWSAWMAQIDTSHESLVELQELSPKTRNLDVVYRNAVRQATRAIEQNLNKKSLFEKVLFPSGPPSNPEEKNQALNLYKIIVSSSEELVSRRQAVNTFFLTTNGALLTACGIVLKASSDDKLSSLGIVVLLLTGVILCVAWRSLITSFGQLNRGKFQVINAIEKHLNTAIYSAEWEALGRGKDPKIYRSFTSREIWVPITLFWLYFIAALVTILSTLGYLPLGPTDTKP